MAGQCAPSGERWDYEECTIDSDCAEPLMGCITDVLSSGNFTTVCTCYGYYGSECGEERRCAFQASCQVSSALAPALVFIFAPLLLLRLIRTLSSLKSSKQLSSAKAQSTTLLIIGCFSWWVIAAGALLMAIGLDDKFIFEKKLKTPFVALITLTGLIGILIIAAVWIEIEANSRKLKAASKGKELGKLGNYLRGFALVFALIQAVLFTEPWAGASDEAVMLQCVIELVVIVTFTIGSRKLVKMVAAGAQMSKGTDEKAYKALMKSLRSIIECSNGICAGFALQLVGVVAYLADSSPWDKCSAMRSFAGSLLYAAPFISAWTAGNYMYRSQCKKKTKTKVQAAPTTSVAGSNVSSKADSSFASSARGSNVMSPSNVSRTGGSLSDTSAVGSKSLSSSINSTMDGHKSETFNTTTNSTTSSTKDTTSDSSS